MKALRGAVAWVAVLLAVMSVSRPLTAAPAQSTSEKTSTVTAFDLEKERQKAAGSFDQVKDGRRRRSPFQNPLAAQRRAPAQEGLPEEVQKALVREAELALGLYKVALNRGQREAAQTHLNRLMQILSQADSFTVEQYRDRLDRVQSELGETALFAEWRFQDIRAAFQAGEYDKVATLYEELQAFVAALPKEEKDKLTEGLAQLDVLARKAKARVDFAKLSMEITGVVLSEPRSYATINDVVVGVGDLVRKPPEAGSALGSARTAEPLEPPVKIAEIHLNQIVFEFEGELLTRNVGRRYITQERLSAVRRAAGSRRGR